MSDTDPFKIAVLVVNLLIGAWILVRGEVRKSKKEDADAASAVTKEKTEQQREDEETRVQQLQGMVKELKRERALEQQRIDGIFVRHGEQLADLQRKERECQITTAQQGVQIKYLQEGAQEKDRRLTDSDKRIEELEELLQARFGGHPKTDVFPTLSPDATRPKE